MFNHELINIINALSQTQTRQASIMPTNEQIMFAVIYMTALMDLLTAIGEQPAALEVCRKIERLTAGRANNYADPGLGPLAWTPEP